MPPDSTAAFPPHLELIVTKVACEAKTVAMLELQRRDGQLLPPFEPGAHLEVRLGNHLTRHYSLCGNPQDRTLYRLGVGQPANSRGGSRFIHESVRVGDVLRVSHPRNNFPLVEGSVSYCFVAGGIGITPILAMVYRCLERKRPFRLFYCARNRQRAAFYEELLSIAPDAVSFHFDNENDNRCFDAKQALADIPSGTHIYCCGPAPLMTAVEEAGKDRLSAEMHFEWFTPQQPVASEEKGFEVRIRSTGKTIEIPVGTSILDVLDQHGVLVPYSCREGLCGTCRTGVLSGIPEHRDSVLSAEERAQNNCMMLCVSRAASELLELDL